MRAAGQAQSRPGWVPARQRSWIGHPGRAPGAGNAAAGAGQGESGELHLPSYGLFSSTEILTQMALEKMLAGLSSRRYNAGLEPAGQAVESAAASTSKSAVSRRFVAATETALAELMTRRLDDLDLVAFMVDGVHFGEHTCVVALGIGIDPDPGAPSPWRRARLRTPPWSRT